MYDENRIRVLTEVEKQSHSVDSILSILLDKYPSTSHDHLTRVAECLVTFGWGVAEYDAYRAGMLGEEKRQTMVAWFTERNSAQRWAA